MYDRRLFHAPGHNRSNITRIVGSIRGMEGTVSRLMERSDPIRRQLLGAKTCAMGTSSPREEDMPLRSCTWAKKLLPIGTRA